MANLTTLRDHLFAAIEGVSNLNDPNASEADKTTMEQAKAMCDISKNIIETYKVEVQAMAILSKTENPQATTNMAIEIGIIKKDK